MLTAFEKKIQNKTAKIGVIGLGYVGLPLAVSFARNSYAALGIDVDSRKVKAIQEGRSYVLDVSSDEVRHLAGRGFLKATDSYQALSHLDAIIICVPTPLSKTKEPDISFIVNAVKNIARFLRKGQLVVLESTTYPGTTDEVLAPILEKSGLKVERDFFLAFSPERVDPGNKEYDTASIPKVVGGVGKNSLKAATALYSAVMKKVVPVSSAKTAEMAKLLENTFRSVNIGLINEMAVLCSHLHVDIWEVIEAAKTKPFGFMPFYPGPGIGGHCLPIDPVYLSWKSRIHGYEAKMIELASSINEAMPFYVVEKIQKLLNDRKMAIKNSQILVLGVSYKKDVDDVRESPAADVVEHLLKEGAKVAYSDPWVPEFYSGATRLKSQKLTPAFLKKQHGALLLTNHSAFDGKMIVQHSKLILDTRNALRKFLDAKKNNLFFL